MNTFSERELSQLRLNYTQGKDLDCPRCGRSLSYGEEKGDFLPMQRPGGPLMTFLLVECMKERISGRTLLR